MLVSGALISSVCSAGGEVSFSGASRRTVGVDLVGGGRASRGCRLPPAFGPLLVDWWRW